MFFEKELQKTNQQEFRVEKIIKKKGDKLYVKWKGHMSNGKVHWIAWLIKKSELNKCVFSSIKNEPILS